MFVVGATTIILWLWGSGWRSWGLGLRIAPWMDGLVGILKEYYYYICLSQVI